ncbi:MAG: DUF4446 family protein [Actinomycetes bacterium]
MPDIDLPLSRDVLDLITVAAAAAAGLGLLLALLAHVRVRRLRRRVDATPRWAALPPARPGEGGQAALRRVAVVRFDAFPDISGMLSFSAALLDDAGHGLVLTSIHGRNEARTYAKALHGGVSSQPLSPEEQEAIEEAFVGGESTLVGTGNSTGRGGDHGEKAGGDSGRIG